MLIYQQLFIVKELPMFNRFEQFTTAISQIYKSVQKIKTNEVNSYGLKANHVMILFQLKKHEDGLTPSQLCELCDVDKAAISRAVKELTSQGFIRNADSDGRKYRVPIFLTDEGEEAALHIEQAIKHAVEIGGAGLTDRQRVEFYRSLLLIAHNLENYTE